ncbi:TPA: DUF4314 domain-containing protein [Streptococcus agalactiae]
MDDKTLERLRKTYPTGTRVRLVHMDAPYSVPIGMLGTVEDVDDIGSLIVSWDNGQSLNVLHGIDRVVIVEPNRHDFIRSIYCYLRAGHNEFVFDSGDIPVQLTHEEVITLMTSTHPQTEIDIYIDECNHFNLKPTAVLTKEEIEKAIQE